MNCDIYLNKAKLRGSNVKEIELRNKDTHAIEFDVQGNVFTFGFQPFPFEHPSTLVIEKIKVTLDNEDYFGTTNDETDNQIVLEEGSILLEIKGRLSSKRPKIKEIGCPC